MKNHNVIGLIFLLLFVSQILNAGLVVAGDSCLDCHSSAMTMTFKDGKTQSLQIDSDQFKQSVHQSLRCVDCHFGFSEDQHPKREYNNKRELTILTSENCRRCHFDKYSQTHESIHYSLLEQGFDGAPVCVDCHGDHAIQSGQREKLVSARRCENCHSSIFKTYTKSVHGSALLNEHNQDVPICSDCHNAHQIIDPTLVDFRNNIPQMCGNCHADQNLMQKYGLSTEVLESYLQDFHGITLSFYKKQQKGDMHQIAVCTDCHGIHDITTTRGPDSSVVMANLKSRCQKCHPNAGDTFPETWISHYKSDFKRAPLVFMVNFFYKLFIPFMMVGLLLQIFLHIWRYAVNR